MSPHQLAYAHKRRSTRIEQAVPLVVQGVGAMREPYQEQVSTLSISCHGCSYVSKHEVIQGETVYLDIKLPTEGSGGYSGRARVKWAQKLGTKDRSFQIAVEFEVAGNIWGVATPPVDWFPLQISEGADPASVGRELKVVARKELPATPAPDALANRPARPVKNDAMATANPAIAQLMVGFGEQIQTMAAEAAAAALAKEKPRLLEEFRAQLHDEAVKAIQSAIFASKEVISRQALKDLSDAHETGARNSHAQWREKIEQDMRSAQQHMLNQRKEVTERVDALAASTIDRVQKKMEATRGEAVDRFVGRIREQVAPMLEVAKDSLKRLEGAEVALRKESEAIFAGIENQLAFNTNESLEKAQQELEKTAVAITARANEALLKLSQACEKTARDNVNAVLASAGNQMSKIMKEKAAEASREFSAGLEGHTQSYLESISKSLAEIPRNIAGRSGQ